MLIIDQKRLLAGDFTSNLKLLQNYPRTSATSTMSPTSCIELISFAPEALLCLFSHS
jgi:hypothetical protein